MSQLSINKKKILKMLWNMLYKKCGNGTKQNRLMLVSNCAVCGKKNLRIIKNKKTNRLELH